MHGNYGRLVTVVGSLWVSGPVESIGDVAYDVT